MLFTEGRGLLSVGAVAAIVERKFKILIEIYWTLSKP